METIIETPEEIISDKKITAANKKQLEDEIKRQKIEGELRDYLTKLVNSNSYVKKNIINDMKEIVNKLRNDIREENVDEHVQEEIISNANYYLKELEKIKKGKKMTHHQKIILFKINMIIKKIGGKQIECDNGEIIDNMKQNIIENEEKYNGIKQKEIFTKEMMSEVVEYILDSEVATYNGYTNENPMKGVNWDKSKKKYEVRIGGEKRRFDDKEDAIKYCEDKLNSQKEGGKNEKMIPNNAPKIFEYQNKYFITYWEEEKPYFDIQHILSYLDVETSAIAKKYNSNKNKIMKYTYLTNNYGGKIKRELIDEETMFNIILSSNSKFSKTFKSDISKILVELREKGMLLMENNEIKLNDRDKIPKYSYTVFNREKLVSYLYVQKLIRIGTQIPIAAYNNEHVIYAFIMDLPNVANLYIVKYGYTADIFDRIKGLKTEYNCDIFLVGLMKIKSKKDEEKFHKYLKETYPELHYKCKINGTNKKELYYLCDKLMYEFDNYNEGEKIEGETEIEDDEIKNYMLNMERKSEEIYGRQQMVATGEVTEFVKEIEKTKQMELELKNKEIEYKIEVEKTKQKEYETKQKEIESNERLKQKEIESNKNIEIMKTICKTVKNEDSILNIVKTIIK